MPHAIVTDTVEDEEEERVEMDLRALALAPLAMGTLEQGEPEYQEQDEEMHFTDHIELVEMQ